MVRRIGSALLGGWLAWLGVAQAQTVTTQVEPGPPGLVIASPAPLVVPSCCPDPSPCAEIPQCACAGSGSVYLNTDYLLWWIKNPRYTIPIITTGNPNSLINPGALNDPTTVGLFGNQSQNYNALSGLRGTAGVWLDSSQTWSAEVGGFWLEKARASYSLNSDSNGNLFLANPVLVNIPGLGLTEAANILTYPGSFAGGATISSTTSLWGMEANGTYKGIRYTGDGFSVDIGLLGGFRYLDLRETTEIGEATTLLATSSLPQFFLGNLVNAPATVITQDRFATSNHFYGGQVGFNSAVSAGRWVLGVNGKIALGDMQETIQVSGTSTLFQSGQPALATPGGVYAQLSNIGRYSSNVFAVVPEIEARVGYRLSDHVLASVGYDFLFISRAVRASEQLDRRTDELQVPAGNPAYMSGYVGQYPMVPFTQTSLWVQGLTVSLRLDF